MTMTPAKYFYKRLREEIRFQYKVIHTVADWVVQIYVGIPALFALIVWQGNMWYTGQTWMDGLPLPVFLVLLAVLLSFGSLRLYIREADVLFLRQQKEWFEAIVHRGLVFSFLRDFLIAGFWFVIASPFLILQYHFSWYTVIGLAFLGLLIKECFSYAKHLPSLSQGRLTRSLIYFLLIISFVAAGSVFASFVYLMVIDAFFTGLFLYLVKKRLTTQGTFLNDIKLEQQAKWRLASLIISQASETKKKTVFSRKQPYIFKNSRTMFREKTSVNRLVDAYIKLLIRRPTRMYLYAILLVLTITFILVASSWVKWVGWIAILFLVSDWLRGHVKEASNHSFLELWHWQPETKRKAGRKTIFVLLLPLSIISGAFLGGLVFSWLGVLVVMIFGFVISFPIAKWFMP